MAAVQAAGNPKVMPRSARHAERARRDASVTRTTARSIPTAEGILIFLPPYSSLPGRAVTHRFFSQAGATRRRRDASQRASAPSFFLIYSIAVDGT